MYSESTMHPPKAYIRSSMLLLLAFATAFFPRILDTLGAPAAVNFLHFATVPLAFGWVIMQPSGQNRTQLASSKALLVGLGIFLAIIATSALVNNAGVINVILEFILLAEPFMFLLALVWIPMAPQHLKRFQYWIFGFTVFHIALALAQWLLIEAGILRVSARLGLPQDNIQGVFYVSGGGHVVGASVSISYAIYYFISAKKAPTWLRFAVIFASMVQVLVAETKQVMFVCLVSAVLLVLVQLKDIRKTLQYVIIIGIVVFGFLWCVQNVEAFRGYNTWAKPELYGPEGEATVLKLSSIRIILSYHESFWHTLFGLGPGHTVGRLGGWMLERYGDLLRPFGATIHPASQQTWDVVWGTRLGPRSSMFSPFFGWAGIWGDLGIAGLGAFLFMCGIVWTQFCADQFSKYLMINILLHGFIFTQMEEPGYMLYMAVLIGLRWHELRGVKNFPQYSSSAPPQPPPQYPVFPKSPLPPPPPTKTQRVSVSRSSTPR